MKDALDIQVIPSPEGSKCDVCNDGLLDIIFVQETDECLCVNCYVNKYGVQEFIKYYFPLGYRLGKKLVTRGKIQ